MGGVAKAVGGAAGAVTGSKGSNKVPTAQIREAQVYPDFREPFFNAIGDARRLYEQGYSVPGMNQRQQQGVESIEDAAYNMTGALNDPTKYASWLGGGGGLGDAPGQDFLQNIYRNGAPSAGYGTQEQILQGLMGNNGAGYGSTERVLQGAMGNNGAGYGNTENIATQTMGQTGNLDYLRNAAGGGMLGGNPHLDSVLSDINRQTTGNYQSAIGSLEGQMSRAGGAGGSVEAALKGKQNETLARELGANEARIRYGDYGQERGYQQQAGMALPGAYAQDIQTKLGAQGQLSDMEARRMQQQLGAAGQLNQMQASRIGQQQGAAGQLSDMQYRQLQAEMQAAQQAGQGYRSDIGQALQAGGMMPQLGSAGFMPGQQLMQAGAQTRDMLQQQQNQPWDNFANYLNNMQSLKNTFLGTAPAGAAARGPTETQQILGNIGQVAQMGMMMSDRRLKTDVELVGLRNGLEYYSWNYSWGGPRFIGPMAQDVLRVAPELVRVIDGWLAIPAAMIRRA